MTQDKAVVIGSGFAGLSAASFLAKQGWSVTVIEKHASPGGRARQLKSAGFLFDMGPSWYWMPDVFENYFKNLGKKRSDYYDLKRLDPSYRVYWDDEHWNIPADYKQVQLMFEKLEPGSARQLDKFLKEACYKYEVGMKKLVYKPGLSVFEFAERQVLSGVLKLDLFTSMKSHVAKYFKDKRIRQLLEFPVLFLGALPENIPALYSLMNYADIRLGTWYPQGGMYAVVQGMYTVAKELGVKFIFNSEVKRIRIDEKRKETTGVTIRSVDESESELVSNVIIASADYHFVEQKLLPVEFRNYDDGYWQSKTMAPSCLIYFVGLNKKLKNISHHSLFFDVDFAEHGSQIYQNQRWPTEPLFYVCTPSVTDESVAPPGCENLFFLVPVASGLQGDTGELRKDYFTQIVKRFEARTGENISKSIIVFETYSLQNFVDDYNAFRGNAYGLANTLKQTANLKPSCRNKKLSNLFYTGQLTVPGPGVPPSLISGEMVARIADKYCKTVNSKTTGN